jgi:hypothetical protein
MKTRSNRTTLVKRIILFAMLCFGASIFAAPSLGDLSTNLVFTNPKRQKIYQKLNTITFEKISIPYVQLSALLPVLTNQTRRLDPDHQGVNFTINRANSVSAASAATQPQIDPVTGTPIAPAPVAQDDVDLDTVTINFSLENVRLVDVLEAIVKTADYPIKYSVLDSGVEFSFRGPETPELFARTFMLDSNAFYQVTLNSGKQANPTADTNFPSALSVRESGVLNYFKNLGVDLSPPKSIFVGDRRMSLTIRAAAGDLDLIEAALNRLNTAPPEVTIKVKFVELEAKERQAFGLDWLMTNGVTTNYAILTEPQFKVILRALEQRDGTNALNGSEVTTLSGRQARFQIVPEKFPGMVLVTNSSGYGSTLGVLDVTPAVLADGYTIQMDLIPKIIEPVGYDGPGTGSPSPPRTRVSLAKTTCAVWDGQTVVLGKFRDELIAKMPSSEVKQPPPNDSKKQLLIFITPTILDPAGNRVHSPDELPFVQTGTPEQKP